MRMRSALGMMALFAVPSAAMAQEAVTLRIGGQPGQFNRYESTFEMFMRPSGQMASMMSSDTTLPFQRMVRYSTRTLTAVTGDTLAFTEVLDSARQESPAMPQMAAMMPPMPIDTTITKMDARGRIFTLDIGDTPVRREPGMGQGRGGPPGGGRMMGERMSRSMFVLPAHAIRVGESWSDSNVTQTEMGGSNLLATYRLERIENRGTARIAHISMNGTQSTSAPGGAVIMSVTGQIQYDVTNHRLAEMEVKMSGNMNNPQMGGNVPVRMHLKTRLI